ncbi:hypothetical protein FDP41_003515 [Naegleria fowleri]|uniref:Thioredoxin domain-containing protein n=1 Tax=Naegleria fowleri TaxID=5763 RepID=A0A6A5BI24_NAEFO|nr:uncharacterized protein FDP41_003515 [Naegleria fowleri]KAF0977523.1 hypothetical protein FDP41_003515 [Naegleria fowleri]
MPTRQLKSQADLDFSLSESGVMGYTVVYIYDDSSPTHSQLKPAFELISRECPFSHFFTISYEDCEGEGILEKYNINTFPYFLVFKGQNLIAQFESETANNLSKQLRKLNVAPPLQTE